MSGKRSTESLRICIVAARFVIQGRATDQGFLWPIAKHLSNRGHHVTVISTKSFIGKPEVERNGVKVYYLHDGFPNLSHMKFEKAVLQKFLALHKETPFDIVHSMDRSANLIGKYKKNLGCKIAYDINGTQMTQLFSILGMSQESVGSLLQTGLALVYKFLTTYFLGGDRDLLKNADGVFVGSPQQKIFLERYYLYPEFKTYTVPYGIELGDLSIKESDHQMRTRFQIPEGAHLVITFSDLTDAKETTVILKAFEKVAIKKPNAYLCIVGNGPAWKDVEFELLSLALGSKAIMTGALKGEEISELIADCDVLIDLGAKSSGLDPVMVEAMAQKKIIIGSEMSPTSDLIADGKDGFLIRPADSDYLSQLLLNIFSGVIPSSEVGERARAKVLGLFDTKKMVDSIETAYRNMLK